MSELTIRVESIYDVALAKLILDNQDITLATPSTLQQELLGLEPVTLPHNVHIGDLDYRSGIQIKGSTSGVTQIENLLRERLPDAIVFKHPIQQDAIYNARVEKYIYRKKLAILDIGDNQKVIMFNSKVREGEELLVQIKELTTEKDKLPICSDIITLSGDYVILEVGADFVRISRKIKGNDRRRLHNLGKELLPDGFGIIIRTSANAVDNETIQFEINKLRQLWEKIENGINDSSTNEIFAGEKVSEIILGNSSKTFLDNILSELTATMPNYHLFKAYSMATGFTAEFAQKFSDSVPLEVMSEELENMILERDFPINNHIKAEFNYLDGHQEQIIIGNITKNKPVMVTSRKIEKNEEISLPIFDVHESDICEIHFSYGSWTLHYKYYSGLTGELLGDMLRIITPLDIVYRGRIRAFDMGMAIYKNADGETTSEVDDSISNMVEKGMISKSLDEKLGEVLRVAMSMLKTSSDEILIQLGL